METACSFECLGGTTWSKVSDTCIPPDTCSAPTYAGYFGEVVEQPCQAG